MDGGTTVSYIDSTGFHLDPLADVTLNLTAAMQSIYGSDVNVSPETPDGQWIGVLSNAIYSAAQGLQYVYSSLDVRNARGVELQGRVALNGITPKAGTNSTCTFLLTGALSATIPEGTQLQTDSAVIWATVAPVTLGSVYGTATVLCAAVPTGALSATSGSTVRIMTPLYGLQDASVVAMVTTGTPQESDVALQLRRAQSVALPSQSKIDSLRARVLAVPNVLACAVYDNPSDVATNIGSSYWYINPHSVAVCVHGPAASATDIAQALWLSGGFGNGFDGDITHSVVDSQGFSHTMTWRAAAYGGPLALHCIVYMDRGPGWPGDAVGRDLVMAAIADYISNVRLTNAPAITIGSSIYVAEITAAALSVPGALVTRVQIWKGSYGYAIDTGSLAFDVFEIATFTAADPTNRLQLP